MIEPHVLLLESYYGGSHQAFLDGWISRSIHDWQLLSLPPNKWKWRMRHGPITVVEAIEAPGASRLQVLWYGILPQVLPVIYGTAVYRWDINIRESTVLGFVGAGGIGSLLFTQYSFLRWDNVAVIIIELFFLVLIV